MQIVVFLSLYIYIHIYLDGARLWQGLEVWLISDDLKNKRDNGNHEVNENDDNTFIYIYIYIYVCVCVCVCLCVYIYNDLYHIIYIVLYVILYIRSIVNTEILQCEMFIQNISN